MDLVQLVYYSRNLLQDDDKGQLKLLREILATARTKNVEHGVTGYLVDFQRPHALAEGLEILLGDSALRQRLAEAGQRTARQRFSSEQMVAGYTNILNSF